jgi:hypothetical protein
MAVTKIVDSTNSSLLEQRQEGEGYAEGEGKGRAPGHSHSFPSWHPDLVNGQFFRFGTGIGISAVMYGASSFSDGSLEYGTLGSDSPYAGREYGGVNRVSYLVLSLLLEMC